MFDEFDRLKESPELLQLLTHYADLGAADRQIWQDRLMTLEGVEPRELTKLHGELIAYSWVDQNTGNVSTHKPGVVAGCYRITLAGQRAILRMRGEWSPEDEHESEVPAEKMRATRGTNPGEKKPRVKRAAKIAEVTGDRANQAGSNPPITVAGTTQETNASESNRSPEDQAA